MVDGATPRSSRGALAVIAIFALGVVFGVALSFAIVHHVVGPRRLGPAPGGGPAGIGRLTRQLDLDPAQQEAIRGILDRGHATMRGVLDDTRLEIRAVLRPDQQQRFDRMRTHRPPFSPPGPRPGAPRP